MAEHPIIFSTEMIEAILDNRKTQTRRVIKPPKWTDASSAGVDFGCPYGHIDDMLWVKEALCIDSRVRPSIIKYAVDNTPLIINHKLIVWSWKRNKLNSLFMPRWASRIRLEITDVRVERLQEIKEADCLAEGIKRITTDGAGQTWFGPSDVVNIKTSCVSTQGSFKKLWDSINGKAHPWESNPWVWVIEFKKIKTKPFGSFRRGVGSEGQASELCE